MRNNSNTEYGEEFPHVRYGHVSSGDYEITYESS